MLMRAPVPASLVRSRDIVDLDRVGRELLLEAGDRAQQPLFRDGGARVEHQVFEDRPLARREVHRHRAVPHFALAAVDDQFATGDDVDARRAPVAPHEGTTARDQLARIERRVEMVVGAGIDRRNARVGGAGVGDDQHRQPHAPLAKPAQPLEPGLGGAPQVEDDVVEVPASQHRIGLVGPVDDVHGMTRLAQRTEDPRGIGLVVADDQDLHGWRAAVSGRRGTSTCDRDILGCGPRGGKAPAPAVVPITARAARAGCEAVRSMHLLPSGGRGAGRRAASRQATSRARRLRSQ
ncbi:MAG: hypothetical protein R3E41_12200 [Burkholderiaceae bacterium]